MSKVALIQLDRYDQDELNTVMAAAFDKLNLSDLFEAGERILIKPNMLSAVSPDKHVTPHPHVFQALAGELKKLKLILSYGDSPAIDSPERAARICGFESVAQNMNIERVDFSSSIEKEIPDAAIFRRMPLAKGVDDADGLVTLAKMKTHALTSMTGVLKNQFGVIPGTVKAKLHVNYADLEHFSMMLADINRCVSPRMAVMDGIIAMEGNGPRNGRPKEANMLLVSADLVAVDTLAAVAMGLEPAELPAIRHAAASGLGEMDPEKIELILMQVSGSAVAVSEGLLSEMADSLLIPDFQRAETQRSTMTRATRFGAPLARQFLLNRPVIDPELCTRCGICVKTCPVEPKAVLQKVKSDVPVYHYQRCIRCYCCQETCPEGAIMVRKSLINRLMRA